MASVLVWLSTAAPHSIGELAALAVGREVASYLGAALWLAVAAPAGSAISADDAGALGVDRLLCVPHGATLAQALHDLRPLLTLLADGEPARAQLLAAAADGAVDVAFDVQLSLPAEQPDHTTLPTRPEEFAVAATGEMPVQRPASLRARTGHDAWALHERDRPLLATVASAAELPASCGLQPAALSTWPVPSSR